MPKKSTPASTRGTPVEPRKGPTSDPVQNERARAIAASFGLVPAEDVFAMARVKAASGMSACKSGRWPMPLRIGNAWYFERFQLDGLVQRLIRDRDHRGSK